MIFKRCWRTLVMILMMGQFHGSRCNWQTYAGVAELAGVVGVCLATFSCEGVALLHSPHVQCALCVSVQAMHSNEAASLSNQWIVHPLCTAVHCEVTCCNCLLASPPAKGGNTESWITTRLPTNNPVQCLVVCHHSRFRSIKSKI